MCVVAKRYEEMKAILIDGECVGANRRRCGLLRCTFLYFLCNCEGNRDTFRSMCVPAEYFGNYSCLVAVRERVSV
jgi:hypothetical protein